MKKVLFTLLAGIALVAIPMSLQAQGVSKFDAKEIKKEAKELTKAGWTSERGTILAALMKVAEKEAAGCEVLMGTSYNMPSLNGAKRDARNKAITEYAELSSSMIKGRIVDQGVVTDEEAQEKLVSGFERLVKKELENEIDLPTAYFLKGGKGDASCKGYYTINKKRLESIKKKALEKATEEAGAANDLGNKMSTFIKDGFNEE